MKVTSQHYGQFLLNSPQNFTSTYFADSVEGLSHDSVYRYLRDSSISPDIVREYSREDLVTSPNGYLIFDDTVIDKNHSRSIELVRKQYSGNAGRVIRGIGMVTAIYFLQAGGLTRMISPDRTDYVVTNDITQDSSSDARKAHAVRWKIEEFHRELKQLTGIETVSPAVLAPSATTLLLPSESGPVSNAKRVRLASLSTR